jgi:hypothetical protein
MQTAQTQFPVLGPFSVNSYYAAPAGSGAIPNNGPFTVGLLLLPNLDDAGADEFVFGNLDGNEGFGVRRINMGNDRVRFDCSFGTGGATTFVGASCPAAGILNKPFFLHFTYDGATDYAAYLNGALLGDLTDLAFVSSNAPLYLGYSPTEAIGGYRGGIVAANITYTDLSGTEIFEIVALGMKLHDLNVGSIGNTPAHLWSTQTSALRTAAPVTLADIGQQANAPFVAATALPAPRTIHDVQWSFPSGTFSQPA